MSHIIVDDIANLLQVANENGVVITLAEGKLTVNIEQGRALQDTLLNELKTHKEALIRYLTDHANNSSAGEITAQSSAYRAAGDRIPLSFSQERLWFVDKLAGSINYHIPLILKWQGALNREALRAAFRSVVDRHEVLRTVFHEEEGTAYQVLKENEWDFEGDATDQGMAAAKVDALTTARLTAPFDLSKDYMVRASLVEVAEREYRIIIVFHHIATDGWSSAVFLNELLEGYHARIEGREAALKALPIQYSDYAIWQRHSINQTALAHKLAYWENKLRDVTPLALPTDYSRPAIQSKSGKAIAFTLEKKVSEALAGLANQSGASLFMVMQAALDVLLYRYSGQYDICVGSPIANRTHAATEQLIGFFLNNLVLRNNLRGNPSFRQLLAQVRQTTLEAYQYQDVPFEKILDRLGLERDMSMNPLIQVTLTFHSPSTVAAKQDANYQLSIESTEQQTSLFDLSFHVTETATGLHIGLNYCDELFSSATITHLRESFEVLFSSIAAHPDQSIANLKMLSDREEAQQLVDFNPTAADYPRDESIVALFRAQAAKSPARVALTFEGESWTYQQLDEKSDRLAAALIYRGVEPGHLIGICLERSLEMVLGLLGILKAGAAYVPIDPEQPAERTKYMVEDAGIRLVLSMRRYDRTSMSYEPAFQEIEGVTCLLLDDQGSAIKADEYRAALPVPAATDLAGVMYTSGTSGMPKGALIEHRSIVRLVFNAAFDFLGEETITYQYAPLAFDASTFEIWGALLKGGSVIVSSPGLKSLEAIASDLRVASVNTLWLTAGLFHTAVDNCPVLFEGIQYLLAGGDSVRSEAVKKLLEHYPGLAFINGYGPTESTTFAVTHRVCAPEAIDLTKNVIGRPIAHTRVYVLNQEQALMPLGTKGELYIGGDGLARGYLNNPELTHEKFISSPFDQTRLYKTGDLVRWCASGPGQPSVIEYLDRTDDQV
ncbi:MAG TPA: amino acid adenylation domain-containing protein, partial [Hymenobacter sp.]|nr:amino acid adenylation domain-containing protein [Hymenobacter sp.]